MENLVIVTPAPAPLLKGSHPIINLAEFAEHLARSERKKNLAIYGLSCQVVTILPPFFVSPTSFSLLSAVNKTGHVCLWNTLYSSVQRTVQKSLTTLTWQCRSIKDVCGVEVSFLHLRLVQKIDFRKIFMLTEISIEFRTDLGKILHEGGNLFRLSENRMSTVILLERQEYMRNNQTRTLFPVRVRVQVTHGKLHERPRACARARTRWQILYVLQNYRTLRFTQYCCYGEKKG